MEDYRTRFEIIENTKRGRDSFGYSYGSETFAITEDDIKALIDGKQLASTVNDEYTIFIELERVSANE